MKTCKQYQYSTPKRDKYLPFLVEQYCGHPASAHPVTGVPTVTCAKAREGRSCEVCRPAHCGIDARLYRAPDAPQRPRWLPESETKPGGFRPNEPSVSLSFTAETLAIPTAQDMHARFQAEHDAKQRAADAAAARRAAELASQQAQTAAYVANAASWIQTLSDAVHGVKR